MSKFKKGQYIRWVAERYMKSWDVYGIIRKVEGGEITILTFDDFKETTIAENGPSAESEIKILSDLEVIDMKRKLEDDITKAKRHYENLVFRKTQMDKIAQEMDNAD